MPEMPSIVSDFSGPPRSRRFEIGALSHLHKRSAFVMELQRHFFKIFGTSMSNYLLV